ncbi:MAG: hypothetical protein LBH72_01790 [Proteiniphilum sp.]|jgi:fibronectin type 3 domain-containing protein|nr:hypothetical protein [Proteiniphilum sp.]
MKQNRLLLSALLFLVVGMTACSDGTKEENVNFELSSRSIHFGSEGGSETVYVYTNASWWNLSYSGGGWCSISPNSGNGDGYFVITVDENSSTSQRNLSGSIYSSGSSSASFNISQAGGVNTGGDDLPIPTGLSATKNENQISLSWNSVPGASFYRVYRSSSSSGSYSVIGTSNANNTNDNSPLNGYNYYKVTALNSSGKESNMSNYVLCEYSSAGGNEEKKPTAPTGVTVSNEGDALIPMIAIRWNIVSNATTYKVYRSTSASGSYSQIGTSSVNVLVDGNPREGTSYYKVKAVNSTGESDYSNYASVEYKANDVSPCPVTYGNCTVSGATMTLRWTVSTGTGCGKPTKAYLRVRNPQSGQYVDLETLSGTATSASFSYGMWINSDGYVYVGIILENDKGLSGGVPKVYDNNNKRWIN